MIISPTFISLCIVEVTALAMGIFIVFHNRRSVVNWSFAILLFGLVIIIFGFMLLSLEYPFRLFDPFVHYGGLIMLFGLLIFSRVFPSGTAFPRIHFLLSIPFVVVAVVLPMHLVIEQATFNAEGDVITINGPLFVPYAIFWMSYVCIPFTFLIRTYRRARGKERQQMQYLFAGFIVLLISFIIFGLILPALGVSYLYFMSALSSLVLLFLTVLAIVKHQLLDIRIVIQRGLIYIFLVGMIIGVYITSLQLAAYMLQQITNTNAIISAGVVMVLGILFFRSLENYLRKITDPIFFKDKYDYPDALHRLSKVLHTNVSTADIIRNSSLILKDIFKTEWVNFRLLHAGEGASSPDTVISTKIIFEGNCIGILELGPKKSGDGYTPYDMKLLDTFAYQAAVALEKGRLYEKVEDYSIHLEQLVDDRTREIKKLQEDQKQAMIDISHNLQTPLAIIKGEIDLLVDTPVYTEKIKNVKRSIHKVSLFIRQLLHLAKLDHAAFQVEFAPVDLSALLLGEIEYFEVMAAEKDIHIVTSIIPDIWVMGNTRLLGELLNNLMSNAIKYRRKGREKSVITISLSEDAMKARLVIRDNGIGIPEEDLPDIFTRFYRGSRKSNTAGTGLGLAISKKIVERHEGSISAESISGEQTSFTIVLPAYKSK